MTRRSTDGLILLVLGSVVFVLLGCLLESATSRSMDDFKGSYYGAKCLLKGIDPYNRNNLARLYHAEEGDRSTDSDVYSTIATTDVYLPPTLGLMVPIGFLHYGPAHRIWIISIAASYLLASFLMWEIAAKNSPEIAACLICILIADSVSLIYTGNPAGIAISLSIIACWCFIRNRWEFAGLLCLAIGLSLKPHDAGPVWLFFLLAGGHYRKRALQALLVVTALAMPMVLWVTSRSPHWVQELHSSLVQLTVRGGINDPGPTSLAGHGIGGIVDLQAAISFLWDKPQLYNYLSYAIVGSLLLIWLIATLRKPLPQWRAWIGLAAIAPLAMLPIYHRQYDAKLILLTVPACMIAWKGGGLTGRLAIVVNALGFLVVGDLPLALLEDMISVAGQGISERFLMIAQAVLVPLTLLAMGLFYLWLYVRCSPKQSPIDTRRLERNEACATSCFRAPPPQLHNPFLIDGPSS